PGAYARSARPRLAAALGGDPLLDETARRLDDLRAPPVVECDPETERVERGRPVLERAHLLLDRRVDAIAPAEEACPHALLREIRELLVDRLGEEDHEVRDLVRGTGPVLRGERVDDERLDPEVDCRLDRPAKRAGAGPVALRDGRAVRLGPAAVAVHDDRDHSRLARLVAGKPHPVPRHAR